MYFFDYRLFDRVKRKRGYDPKYPDQKSFMKDLKNRLRLDFGICSEIQDEDGKLRVKVHFPHWGQNIISDWVPIIRPFGGSEFGLATQPEIGDKLICMFINADRSHPLVIGGIYNKGIAHPPFKMAKGNHIRAITSRTGSKIVFNDEDGEEKIQIYMKDGKIRGTFSKSKGIALVNELGDIKVKCRKLTIEAGDAATIKFKKQLKITCDQENLTMKSKKGIEFVAGMDVKFKGSKIKLKGIAAAQFKAVAKEGDQVVGVDIHMVKVPAPPGSPIPTPLPHPYVGKLDGGLSQDVVLDNKAVAFKGSKCTHISPGHIPTPPGIAWEGQAPSNKGEITNLTVPTVKVNNKEIAVLGSMVKTCNFPNDMETCTVVAVGAAVKVPMMIPGLPADQFAKDQGSVINTRDLVSQRSPNNPPPTPSITTVKWSGGKAKAGEEVTLTANLSNQYPNAAVYFEIFKEGDQKPFKKVNASLKGSKAEVKMVFQDPKRDADVDSIKYKAKATSFKCPEKESSPITIEKVKPEFENLKWFSIPDPEDPNSSEEEITETPYRTKVKITADVKNIDDGETVRLRVYEEGWSEEMSYRLQEIVEVKDGKVEFEWRAACRKDRLAELTENDELKYVFNLECDGAESSDSGALQLVFVYEFNIHTDPDETGLDEKFVLKCSDDDSKYSEEKSVQNDMVAGDKMITLLFENIKPGLNYTLEYIPSGQSSGDIFFSDKPFKEIIED